MRPSKGRRMIPASIKARQRPTDLSWQRQLAEAISSPAALLEALGLDPAVSAAMLEAADSFRVRVPWSYVRRMRYGDAADPLLRQVFADPQELAPQAGYSADPLAEQAARTAAGLLQKFHGRALLVTTGACAVHCRYCFRREFPYAEQADTPRWAEALARIAEDRSIEEVILSGGDPLTLTDSRLGSLTQALSRIEHVRRLRIHTRLPVVLPARVDDGLVAWLRQLPWPTVMVLHANHANEIDAEVRAACARLAAAGVTLLNQSVLLKGVNDDAASLAALSASVFEAGVLPYYLHQLDRVRGAAHFEVPDVEARRIAGELAARLPGYLVPRLVREQAGAPSKLPLAPHFPAGSGC